MGKIKSVLLGLVLTAATIITTPVFGDEAVVDYNKDSDGNNISIKSIQIDPYTYYDATDLIGGKTDLTPDHLEKVASKLFEDWGPVASEIFRNNTAATFHNDNDDTKADWDKYYGTGVAEADEKTDVKAALSGKKKPDKYFHGKKSNDCVLTSGLSYATKLDDVVTHMCQDVAEGLGERYNTESGTIYSKIDLKSVKDKKETKAYYRIVTSIDNNGETYGYYYNSYALVLYDFELAPIVAEGVTVTNAVEKEDNTGTTGNKGGTAKSYFENRSQSTSTVSSNFSYTTSESVVNSITNTKTFGFTQTLGTESEISSFLGIANLKQKFSLSVSANQAVSTAIGEQKAITNTYTNATTASVSLPPHTAVSMLEDSGKTSSTITYDCPVALRYKVAVFSISGFRYDDRATLAYWKEPKDFVTIFGTGTKNGGYDAAENLNLRAIKSRNKMERAYGNIVGNDDGRVVVAAINWDNLKDAEAEIKDAATRIPLFSSGASMSLTKETKSTKLGDITPLYPLAMIKVSAPKISFVESKSYSYGSFNFLKGTMNVGDSSYTDYIDLSAFNRFGVEYYGFVKGTGTWTITDPAGKELSADDAPVILEKNPVTKNVKFTAVKPGICYLKYNIKEDQYTSQEQPEDSFTKNEDLLRTAGIELTVLEETEETEAPPIETISVSGSFAGYVGEAPADLNQDENVVVSIRDESGREIEKAYNWEAQELPSRGMLLNNGMVSFTKAGTFHVRAVSGSLISDWVPVTAKIRTYRVTFDAADRAAGTAQTPSKGNNSSETVTVNSGEKVTAKTPENVGCRAFIGWFTDPACKTRFNFDQPIRKDTTLYAGWADSHDLKKNKDAEPTCEKDGHIEYYTCKTCGKLFADASAKKELTQKSIVLKATGHKWSDWEVTRAATYKKEGIETRHCLNDPSHKEKRTIPKLVKETKKNQCIIAYLSSTSKKSITIRWTRLKDATSYEIYAGECGDALEKACTLNAANSMKRFRKVKGAKIRQDMYYKFYVIAYGKDSNGKTIEIGRSPIIHAATATLAKYSNYTRTVIKSAKTLSLKVGGSAKVKAVQKKKGDVRVKQHRGMNYVSSDPEIAKVGLTSGKVTARKAGTCKIYCVGQSGIYKAITVRVR